MLCCSDYLNSSIKNQHEIQSPKKRKVFFKHSLSEKKFHSKKDRISSEPLTVIEENNISDLFSSNYFNQGNYERRI